MSVRRRKDAKGVEKKDAPSHKLSLAKRRKLRSIERRLWLWPLYFVVGTVALYAVHPTETNPVSRFLFLSYRQPQMSSSSPDAPVLYGKGLWDIAFVAFYVAVLTVTSKFCRQELSIPLARRWGVPRAKRARFAEQMYTALYIAVSGPWGLYIMRHSPVWYFDTRGMYVGYPDKLLTAGFKAYYLVQAAFWAQQVVVMVLGLEERRKDFREFVAHHIVTVALISLSYRFHFTHMGIAIYITHDLSDFFLAISKSLNYLQTRHQGPPFALTVAVWIYLRHYLNLAVLWSMRPGGEFSTVGPYTLNWEAQEYKCPLANVITFTLLALLQALNLFWLYCLLRSAYRYVFMGIAKDDRSEDEAAPPVDVEGEGDAEGDAEEAVDAQANGPATIAEKPVAASPITTRSKSKKV